MVASFATAAQQRGQRWTYLAQIEGIGDTTGLYTWSVNVPDYASATARYTARDTIAKLPDPGGERSPPLGGMPEAGSITLELVDVDDLITAAARIDRPPVCGLDAALTSTGLTITVDDASKLPASGSFLIWTGSETILCDSRAGEVVTVNATGRGYLGTDRRSHAINDRVYLSPPFLRTRRMLVYLSPTDADTETVAQEYLLGSYRIDRIALKPDSLGVWRLGGATEIKDLSRLVCSRLPGALRVESVNGSGEVSWGAIPAARGALDINELIYQLNRWPDGSAFLRVGDSGGQIIRVLDAPNGVLFRSTLIETGLANTESKPLEIGDVLRPVMTYDPQHGSVRHSPGPTPATSRASGTWNVEAHAVDWMLAVLTSSASPDDGLDVANYTAEFGNWSSLPIGYGIGYPASRIDFDSFLKVKERFDLAVFPSLVLGDKPETFAEWATTNFLEPMGWFLAVIGGLLTLVAPRLQLAGELPDATLTADDIVSVDKLEQATELIAGAVIYRYKGNGGVEFTQIVRATDFTALFGSRSQYTVEDETIEIDVPGVRGDQSGLSVLFKSIAQRRLLRSIRAPWRVCLTVDASFHAIHRGSLVAITHPDFPDLEDGVRGWVAVLGEVSNTSPVRIDENRGAVRAIEALVFPALLAGRVAPSAVVTVVTGSGPWACTITHNRYASPNRQDIPDDDAGAFTVGDKLKTISRDGVTVTDGYLLTAKGTDSLTVTSGLDAPVVGDVLVFSDYDASTTQQRGRFVAWADANGEIVADIRGWPYGEG